MRHTRVGSGERVLECPGLLTPPQYMDRGLRETDRGDTWLSGVELDRPVTTVEPAGDPPSPWMAFVSVTLQPILKKFINTSWPQHLPL